jgi:hypothetical protein
MKKLLLCSVLITTAVLTHAQQKTINKKFENIKNVDLSTSSGDIAIRKGTGTTVEVTVKHSYDEQSFTAMMEQRNGTLVLKEEFSRGSHSGNSSWELSVPDNTKLNLNTGSGDVSVEGLKGDVRSNLGSGDVEVSNMSGNMNFNTGSGNINVNKTDGELSFNSGSGDIRASGGSGKYSFNAGSGDITVRNLKGGFSLNTGSGDIEAESLTLEDAGKFNSGSGNATVNLSGSLNHDISVNSGSGDATVNFNGAPIEGEIIMTANERNGDIVAPFKFDKEEVIDDHNSSPRIRKTAKVGNKDVTIKISTGSGTAKISK